MWVGKISYPYLAALTDHKIQQAYRFAAIELPTPPMAICTFPITSDDQFILTVRGDTTVYGGRKYGVGGCPETTKQSVARHQQGELNEEIQVNKREHDLRMMEFYGIVGDQERFPNQPGLMGSTWINVDSTTVKDRIDKRKPEEIPPDVADVTFIPSTEGPLFDYLSQAKPNQFCPPAHGGLILYGHHKFGHDWSTKLLAKLDC